MQYWIALGANMDEPLSRFRAAIAQLAQHGTVIAASQVYQTAPMYVVDQAAFTNAALSWQSAMAPHDVLALLLDIEARLGRVRALRNGPRQIDLDLIAGVDESGQALVLDDDALQLPHPRLAERDFVVYPLLDLAPHWTHPQSGVTVQQMADAVGPRPPVLAPARALVDVPAPPSSR